MASNIRTWKRKVQLHLGYRNKEASLKSACMLKCVWNITRESKTEKIFKIKKNRFTVRFSQCFICVYMLLYVSILLCVCAHALQVCVHMEAKRQYQVFFKCYPPLCLRQSPTDLELVVQRTPRAHLSLAPWNYKHVPPHPAFLCGLWGSNSGPHACGINILFFSKLS